MSLFAMVTMPSRMGALAVAAMAAAGEGRRKHASAQAQQRPVLVQILHRHGARTPRPEKQLDPAEPQPGSDAFNAIWGRCPAKPRRAAGTFLPTQEPLEPCGLGSLTQIGEDQMRSVGERIAAQYGFRGEVGPLYPEHLRVRTTNVPRTILSSAALLQGLYPGISRDEALSLIKLPNEEKPAQETMWGPFTPGCPRLSELWDAAETKIDHSRWDLWDRCRCLRAQGANLPQACSQVSEHHDGYLPLASVEESSREGAELSGGRLASEIHGVIEDVAAATGGLLGTASAPQLVVHGGHDISIIALLSSLGLPLLEVPNFAAAVLIEFFADGTTQDWRVRISYMNGPEADVVELLSLPFTEWCSRMRPLLKISQEWEVRCRAVQPQVLKN